MNINFSQFQMPNKGLLVIGISNTGKLCSVGEKLDAIVSGAISRSLKTCHFRGGFGELIDIATPTGAGPDRISCIGLGDVNVLTQPQWEVLGAKVFAQARQLSLATLTICLNDWQGLQHNTAEIAASIAAGALLKAYQFDHYRTLNQSRSFVVQVFNVEALNLDKQLAESLFKKQQTLVDAVLLARTLVLQPPNQMTPTELCKQAQKLQSLNVQVKVLSGDEALQEHFPGTVAVGRGSTETSSVAIMEWRGPKGDKTPTIALAGKGVTFDAGGLTLKSESQQRLMKTDMAGAATLVAVMQALATLGMDVGVVAAFAAVENMPGGNAFRSGDVITMANGTTVEVTYPDAEGRLVLADLNTYLSREYTPEVLIDVATLTYTVVAALGDGYTGLFSNDDVLADSLLKAAEITGESMWRLPQGEQYLGSLQSHIADLKNMPAANHMGILAGSASVAATFLQHFTTTTGCAWAHLDTTASTWQAADYDLGPAGATGTPVRTLVNWLADMN